MTITAAQLSEAAFIYRELQHVNAALAIVAGGTFTTALELQAPGSGAFRMQVSPPTATLTALLTARQAALQAALTALGITS